MNLIFFKKKKKFFVMMKRRRSRPLTHHAEKKVPVSCLRERKKNRLNLCVSWRDVIDCWQTHVKKEKVIQPPELNERLFFVIRAGPAHFTPLDISTARDAHFDL